MIVLFEIDELLKKVKRIHFIGIGGSGMCPLAEILHKEGYELSGSDNNETDTLARVRSLGIPVTLGQKAENIEGAELIVYTAAILPDNPELVAAKNSSIPTVERADLLGAITRLYSDCYCVCGTHGFVNAYADNDPVRQGSVGGYRRRASAYTQPRQGRKYSEYGLRILRV